MVVVTDLNAMEAAAGAGAPTPAGQVPSQQLEGSDPSSDGPPQPGGGRKYRGLSWDKKFNGKVLCVQVLVTLPGSECTALLTWPCPAAASGRGYTMRGSKDTLVGTIGDILYDSTSTEESRQPGVVCQPAGWNMAARLAC